MEHLPVDIYIHLVNFLTPVEIGRLVQCSKTMENKVDSERIWMAMARKQFGDVTRDDVTHTSATWKVVCRVYWFALDDFRKVIIVDFESRKWPVLYRRSDRCMIIPLCAKGIKARRGDIYATKFALRTGGLDGFESKCIVSTPRNVKVINKGAYGCCSVITDESVIGFEKRYTTNFAIPTEFCYPEFPIDYFLHLTRKIVNIKLTSEMIDEMVAKKTLTLPGQSPIKIPSYEYPLALLPDISVFTWCPRLDAFDEA